MKRFNYLMILAALLMMNVMNAELKTFGMPTETEEAPAEEAPTEEAPTEEAPAEEAPAEEAPAEEAPTEEAPAEEDEMPSASEDNEVSTDQPIKFKEEYIISVSTGTVVGLGSNISNNFSSGLNFEANILTPFSFSGINIMGHLSMFSLGANSSEYTDFSVKNFGIKFAKKISILDLTLGTGLSMSSGKGMYLPYDDYDMTTLFVSGTVSYDLPISGLVKKLNVESLNDLKIAISASGIEIFGSPSEGQTSDLVSFGATISYPILF